MFGKQLHKLQTPFSWQSLFFVLLAFFHHTLAWVATSQLCFATERFEGHQRCFHTIIFISGPRSGWVRCRAGCGELGGGSGSERRGGWRGNWSQLLSETEGVRNIRMGTRTRQDSRPGPPLAPNPPLPHYTAQHSMGLFGLAAHPTARPHLHVEGQAPHGASGLSLLRGATAPSSRLCELRPSVTLQALHGPFPMWPHQSTEDVLMRLSSDWREASEGSFIHKDFRSILFFHRFSW